MLYSFCRQIPSDYDSTTSSLTIPSAAAHVPDSATSPSTLTPPTTPVRSSPPRTVTQEERTVQLRKQLSLLTAERDDLTSQLKLARRESQRTESALKSEIEALKRASEKHASGEHRSRQKVLALQEAVKQASAAAGDIEQMVKGIEETLPGLNERAKKTQALHIKIKDEAEQKFIELDSVMNEDRKMVNELQGELTGVCAKLEKVTGKKEKLENEVVPQLEERLQDLQREIEELERLPLGDEDTQYDGEDINNPSNVRNWVSPIQRPSPQQRSSFPSHSLSNINFSPATTAPFSLPRQTSLRSSRPQTFKTRPNAPGPPLLPSYDPNFSLRGLAGQEESINPAPSSRVTSELKTGSTFHTPPRFQTQTVPFNTNVSFDYVVQRPSPNPVNEDREQPVRQMSLPSYVTNHGRARDGAIHPGDTHIGNG